MLRPNSAINRLFSQRSATRHDQRRLKGMCENLQGESRIACTSSPEPKLPTIYCIAWAP
jgi:hypothetical protein